MKKKSDNIQNQRISVKDYCVKIIEETYIEALGRPLNIRYCPIFSQIRSKAMII